MGVRARRQPPNHRNGKVVSPTGDDTGGGGGGGGGGDSGRANGTANGSANGTANGTANGHKVGNQNMNSSIEFRGKSAHNDSSDSVAEKLMSRESFSLDDHVPQTPAMNNHGFWELPPQDRRSFGLLVLLYFLQGIPMGLATGSVPFLLKDHMSYGEIGIFSLASYPYSLKLLWSPIVDAVWSPKVGRRKSWILPIQFLSGLGMLWLGSTVEDMMSATGKPGGPSVWAFTAWWFFLVFMCATQDIAVDGWALTLLSPGNISYASTEGSQTGASFSGRYVTPNRRLVTSSSPCFTRSKGRYGRTACESKSKLAFRTSSE